MADDFGRFLNAFGVSFFPRTNCFAKLQSHSQLLISLPLSPFLFSQLEPSRRKRDLDDLAIGVLLTFSRSDHVQRERGHVFHRLVNQ